MTDTNELVRRLRVQARRLTDPLTAADANLIDDAADAIEKLTAERDAAVALVEPVEEHARQVEALYNGIRRQTRQLTERAERWHEAMRRMHVDDEDSQVAYAQAIVGLAQAVKDLDRDATAAHAQDDAAGPESPAVGAEPGETITGAQRGAQAADCPTCSGPIRETVGMICQTCGTDYGPPEEEPEQPLTLIAPNGCDDCTVEPGEHHRHPGCPGNHRAITRQAREASQQAHEAAHEAFRRDLANLKARPGGLTWPDPTAE